jgi:hypothetical protein
MASGVYNRFKANLFRGLVDLAGSGSHSIKVGLLTSSHIFVAANNTWTAVSGNETSGTGYSAGGSVLANKAVTQDDSGNQGVFDADDVTWSSSTITAAFAVVYDNTLVSKDLIACYDFGGNQSSSSGNFTIQWNASGLITLA